MRNKHGIDLTQCGQLRPYADSEYAGTVDAKSEEDAKAKLAAWCQVDRIFDKRSRENWAAPYFKFFRLDEPGRWQFRIVEEYTG